MTRFVSEALGVRSGRRRSTYTNAELRRNMQRFLDTGEHPDVEASREARRHLVVARLPDANTTRAHVFLDVALNGSPAGRLVVELFEDMVPLAVAYFQGRCSEGSRHTLKASKVHKLQSAFGAFFGRANGAAPRIENLNSLSHVEKGALSVARDGREVVISLGPALALDPTHQVIGRVVLGDEILNKIDDIVVGPGDVPLDTISVSSCGATNHEGTHDSISNASLDSRQSNEQLVNNAKEDSTAAREKVRVAVEEGLGTKRKSQTQDHGELNHRRKRDTASVLDSWLVEGESSSGSSDDDSQDEFAHA